MKTLSIKTIDKIALYETKLAFQYSDDGILKSNDDKKNYLNQMKEYLWSHKFSLLIWKIDYNSDSITVLLYTGVHYTILPQVEGAK